MLVQFERAIEELRAVYPTVPVGPPEGARNEHSSYLHLIICTWEVDALRQLLGEERAHKVIERRDYYTWIYRQASKGDSPLRRVLVAYGLTLPAPEGYVEGD